MKTAVLYILMFFLAGTSYGQIHEIGVFAGGSNFVGDVGSTSYISPNSPAFGAVYKWNRSPRHSYRASLNFTNLEGNDNDSDDPSRIQRNYSFNSDIMELSLGMEFTFLDFDLHSGAQQTTPYLYTGLSVAFHDNFFFDSSGNLRDENTSSQAWGIPIALGIKTTLNTNFILAFEISGRYTFTDELDGSVPDTKENIEQLSFGNVNNNDWYMFTGVTLTYTFGRNPCYCN